MKPDDEIPDIVTDCLAAIRLRKECIRPSFTVDVEYEAETIEKMRSAASKYIIAGAITDLY